AGVSEAEVYKDENLAGGAGARRPLGTLHRRSSSNLLDYSLGIEEESWGSGETAASIESVVAMAFLCGVMSVHTAGTQRFLAMLLREGALESPAERQVLMAGLGLAVRMTMRLVKVEPLWRDAGGVCSPAQGSMWQPTVRHAWEHAVRHAWAPARAWGPQRGWVMKVVQQGMIRWMTSAVSSAMKVQAAKRSFGSDVPASLEKHVIMNDLQQQLMLWQPLVRAPLTSTHEGVAHQLEEILGRAELLEPPTTASRALAPIFDPLAVPTSEPPSATSSEGTVTSVSELPPAPASQLPSAPASQLISARLTAFISFHQRPPQSFISARLTASISASLTAPASPLPQPPASARLRASITSRLSFHQRPPPQPQPAPASGFSHQHPPHSFHQRQPHNPSQRRLPQPQPAPASQLPPAPSSQPQPAPASQPQPAPASELPPAPASQLPPAPSSQPQPVPASHIAGGSAGASSGAEAETEAELEKVLEVLASGSQGEGDAPGDVDRRVRDEGRQARREEGGAEREEPGAVGMDEVRGGEVHGVAAPEASMTMAPPEGPIIPNAAREDKAPATPSAPWRHDKAATMVDAPPALEAAALGASSAESSGLQCGKVARALDAEGHEVHIGRPAMRGSSTTEDVQTEARISEERGMQVEGGVWDGAVCTYVPDGTEGVEGRRKAMHTEWGSGTDPGSSMEDAALDEVERREVFMEVQLRLEMMRRRRLWGFMGHSAHPSPTVATSPSAVPDADVNGDQPGLPTSPSSLEGKEAGINGSVRAVAPQQSTIQRPAMRPAIEHTAKGEGLGAEELTERMRLRELLEAQRLVLAAGQAHKAALERARTLQQGLV
ncbi:hypothetical protein CYMTET_14473, partial [Cymbomonas tetramitiformis]